jgi:hypothetical protein
MLYSVDGFFEIYLLFSSKPSCGGMQWKGYYLYSLKQNEALCNFNRLIYCNLPFILIKAKGKFVPVLN